MAAALREARNLAERIGQLLEASGDPDAEALRGYVDRALRRVQIEVEELLAESRAPASRASASRQMTTRPPGRAAKGDAVWFPPYPGEPGNELWITPPWEQPGGPDDGDPVIDLTLPRGPWWRELAARAWPAARRALLWAGGLATLTLASYLPVMLDAALSGH